MKQICLMTLALVVCAATSMAQERITSTQWQNQQTFSTAYHQGTQTLYVQREIARHYQLNGSIKMTTGFQQDQRLIQSYSQTVEDQSSMAQGSFIRVMLLQGTTLNTSLYRDSQTGRVQQNHVAHSMGLGLVTWQIGFTQARMLDEKSTLDQWVMGWVLPGQLNTKLWLAHGDDVLHQAYDNDTRMTLGIEKVFGF